METPVRILVVEDDPDLLEATVRLVKGAGHSTVAATSGQSALERTREFRPDLILLDVDLPDINGIEVCRQIKSNATLGEVLVVLITGRYTQKKEQVIGLESGADGYIVRPISNRELLARVRVFIRILHLNRSLREQAHTLEARNEELRQSRIEALKLRDDAVAAQKRAEAALKALGEREYRLRLTLESGKGGLWEWDPRSDAVHWDARMRELFGTDPDSELPSRSRFLELVHPADREGIEAEIARIQENPGRFAIEFRTVLPDGRTRWISSFGDVTRDSTGQPERVIGVDFDITERKRAEEALSESESRLAGIVESAMDAIISVDESQRIVMINSAAEQLFGYEAGRLTGQPLSVLIPERFRSTHARDVDCFGKKDVTNRRMGESSEIRGLRATGEEFPIEASISQVMARGRRKLFTVILRDITERHWTDIRRKLQFVTTRALAESTSLAEAAPAILRAVCESLDWSFGEIWEKSPGAKAMRLAACWHPPSLPLESFAVATRSMKFTKGIGLPGKVWATRRPARIGDVAKDPSFLRREAAATHGLHSAFAYPIVMGSEVFGVMLFFTPTIHGNPQDLMQIFASIGAQIAQFIERRRAEVALAVEQRRNMKALELRARQQTAISRLAQHALADCELDTILDEAVSIVDKVLGFEFCKVLQLQPAGTSLLMRAGTGWKKGIVGHATLPTGPDSQTGYALLSKEPVVIEDLRTETRFSAPQLLLDHGILSGITVLIHGRRQPYGILGAHCDRMRKFSADDLHFLQSVADVLAATVERRDLEEELLEISNREQRWIGQELHDGLCQKLAGLRMKTELIARNLPQDAELKGDLSEIAQLLAGTVNEARMLARGLSPVDIESHGLMSALEELAASVISLHQVECCFACECPVPVQDNRAATHLYRIAQEAIHNAIRHGHAKNIVVTLSRVDGVIKLGIADDGSGLPPNAGERHGMGIPIMSYRAEMIGGRLSIEPRKPRGTFVECRFNA